MKARHICQIMISEAKAPNKYFTEEEIRETLKGMYKGD